MHEELLLSGDGLPIHLAAGATFLRSLWHQVSMMVKPVVEPQGKASQLGGQGSASWNRLWNQLGSGHTKEVTQVIPLSSYNGKLCVPGCVTEHRHDLIKHLSIYQVAIGEHHLIYLACCALPDHRKRVAKEEEELQKNLLSHITTELHHPTEHCNA